MKNTMKRAIKKFLNIFDLRVVHKKRLVDFYLHEYSSYEQYRSVQVFHNRRKISNIWADSRTLDRVAELVLKNSQGKALGLCHGTRNGFEQGYLNALNRGIHAIGTDISETAQDFPNSVQWDFHDSRVDWFEHFDFVYTNSLDQSWKPREALNCWLNQLKRGGLLIIEHTESHGPVAANEMDPFGVRTVVFPYVLTMWFGDRISISHTVEKKKNMELDACLFVVKKLTDGTSTIKP